jgi:Fur family ferric uptake transcriptional regulator
MYGHCVREDCPNRSESDSDEAPSAGETTAKEAATKETEA